MSKDSNAKGIKELPNDGERVGFLQRLVRCKPNGSGETPHLSVAFDGRRETSHINPHFIFSNSGTEEVSVAVLIKPLNATFCFVGTINDDDL